MGQNLAGRVAQRAAGQPQPGTDVERAVPETVADQVRKMEAQFQMAMPRGAEAAQLVRDVLTMISQTPKLRQCVPATVLGGAMTLAQLGLRPGVLGQGWLLPFWDKNHDNGPGQPRGAHKAQLVIGYKGYLELISRSGRVSGIGAHEVYANDRFVLGFRDGRREFTHEVDWWQPRGQLLGWYAAAQEAGAESVSITNPWPVQKMEEHRDKFAMARTRDGKIVGPWRDHFESMARKTMLLRLADMLPKNTDLQMALDTDGKVRVDLAPEGIERGERVIEGVVEADSFEEPAEDVNTTTGEVITPDPSATGGPGPAAMATQAQMNKLHKLLAQRGVTSDDGVREAIADVIGRAVESRTDVTKADANQVIDHLENLPQGDQS